MKILAILLSSLVLVACGGGAELIASLPAPAIKTTVLPVKKATTVTGGNAVVVHMYQALYGMAPSNALLVDYAFQANNDASTFAKNLTDRFASTKHADLAKLVLDNLGVTPLSVPAMNASGQSEYALLVDAVNQLFAAYPTMRGQLILNMTNLLAGLESEATYGGSAAAYNVQSTANFLYSSNPANSITAAVKPPPAPTVTVSLSQSRASVGMSVILAWASTWATSCAGADGLSGLKPTSGSSAVTPTEGGQLKYTISCTGTGGSVSESVVLVVPMPVYQTSYENAKLIKVPSYRLPLVNGIQLFNTRGYADFEQTGDYNYFEMSLVYTDSNPSAPGSLHIFHINADGLMMDITSTLVNPDPATGKTPVGCMHARKAVVADFNGDSVPDVVFSCHGSEASTATQAMRTEYPMLLLSQSNGKFTLSKIPLSAPIYGHGATAADVNGDGKIDVVFADISQNSKGPIYSPIWVLKGNGNGTFAEDHTQFNGAYSGAAVFSIEYLPINGGYLWVAGPDLDSNTSSGFTHAFFKTDASGNFISTPAVRLPSMPLNTIGCTTCMSFPLDVTVNNNILYVLRTPGLTYNSYAIQRVDLVTNIGNTLFTYSGIDFGTLAGVNSACIGSGGNWIDWLRPYDGTLITDDICRSPNLTIQ
jgi:hypothetical protein